MNLTSGQGGLAGTTTEPGSPRLPTVDQLIAIWGRVLDVAPILPDSNFFDLGGDSFLAMTMLIEIERETGIGIPFTAFYEAPTVELLAAFVGKQAPKFSPLVRLKSGGAAPGLFIVHGIGGTVMELTKLGALIDYEGAVYAIQAKGVDGLGVPLSTVEDMASYYLAAIREIQPKGPYLLAGYSFGGLVALEMSRQLREKGQNIDLLVLIDSYAHPRTWPSRARLAVRWRRLMHRMSLLAEHPIRETHAYAQLTVAQFKRRLQGHAGHGRSVVNWLGDHMCQLTPALRRVRTADEMALDAYAPRYYPGKITFLRAERPDPAFPTDPEPIWEPLAQSVTVHTVKGNHFTVLVEHAGSIAARLSVCLMNALAERNMPGMQRNAAPRPTFRAMEDAPC
jgi:thioesterase domain-containing protein/acyl carrier protein